MPDKKPKANAGTPRKTRKASREQSTAGTPPKPSDQVAHDRPFDPRQLDQTIVTIPLLERIQNDGPAADQSVMIDINLDYHDGREAARKKIEQLISEVIKALKLEPMKYGPRMLTAQSPQYIFATLTGKAIQELVRRDAAKKQLESGPAWRSRAIYKIWPDFDVRPLIHKSVTIVKADAARKTFATFGKDIVWAVIDSGVDGNHPHFAPHSTLSVNAPLDHKDFTIGAGGNPLQDVFGHGTHVAGIIAGESASGEAARSVRNESDQTETQVYNTGPIHGMAAECKILSLKALGDDGRGNVSNLIAAIEYIQELNGHGKKLLVHGVNLSVGYNFEPEWFACGQSPLCVEVNRLVRSGVVVVVAAGNTGYGFDATKFRGAVPAGLVVSINDPGNADLAITVGSTHREEPHTYGVSYFSSKGPTGDGRLKPDLVAPGEKIISCSSTQLLNPPKNSTGQAVAYREESGTSMAAPHVSGVIAGFLSVRREFIGEPERVKKVFLDSATDLGRIPYFQGRGLIDLMRAIQSV
jgi:subtilisin family serine protease